jgi:two-component system, cell cycle response regulator
MSTARILVIEDNEQNIELVDYLLRAHGYVSLLASDGREGIRIARAQRPDLILLDIRMPEMDGFAVIEAIRGDLALRTTPTVAVTASVMLGDRERIATAGFDGYLRKPIEPETFIGEIERFLTRSTRIDAIAQRP